MPRGSTIYAAVGRTELEIAARLDTAAGIVGRRRRRFELHALVLEGGITVNHVPSSSSAPGMT